MPSGIGGRSVTERLLLSVTLLVRAATQVRRVAAFELHPLRGRIGEIGDGAAEELDIISTMSQEIVTGSTQESTYALTARSRAVAALVIVVNRKLSTCSRSPLADGARAALRFVEFRITFSGDAVRTRNVRGMVHLLSALPCLAMMSRTPRTGIRGGTNAGLGHRYVGRD
jgi:hypothetical protein